MRDDISQSGVFQVIKGTAVALLISVIFSALFALLLRALPLEGKWITFVTQILKGVSLVGGGLLFISGEKGLWKGLACGVAFTMLGYLTFASLGGDFSLSWLILTDFLLFGGLGALAGVVAVNIKKR